MFDNEDVPRLWRSGIYTLRTPPFRAGLTSGAPTALDSIADAVRYGLVSSRMGTKVIAAASQPGKIIAKVTNNAR
jgi:hypothetical protein